MSTASRSVEERAGRAMTRALIQANPLTVSFQRPVVEATAAGGQRKAGFNTLDPQTVTVIPLSGLVWNRSDTTADEGRLPDVTEQIVGMPELDVHKDDRLPWNLDDQEGYLLVVHVERGRRWRTSALTRFIQESGDA